MATFVLKHCHAPQECRTAYAAWSGFDSPLRQQPTLASCAGGGHEIYWAVSATDERAALAQLPDWLAERTQATEVRKVPIP
jgi:hypothetical protein